MRFVSSANQKQSRTELLILRHVGQQIIASAPSTYDEVVELARKIFNISSNSSLYLETNDLWTAGAVRILPDVWDSVAELLAVVEVKIEHGKSVSFRDVRAEGPGENMPLAGPSKQPATPSKKAAATSKSAQPARAPSVQPPSSASRPTSSRILHIPSKTVFKPKAEPVPTPPSTSHVRQPAASSSSAQHKRPSTPETFEPENTTFEEEPSLRLRSPKKTKRQRIDSEDEDEGHGTSDEPAKRRRSSPPEEEQEEEEAVQEVQEVVVKVEKGAVSSRVERLQSVERRASPLRTPKQESLSADARRRVQSEGGAVGTGSTSKGNAATEPGPNSSPDPEATFIISVFYDEGGEEDDTPIQFKTKYKHRVEKVMQTACRTFGIAEEDWQRAKLCKLVDNHYEELPKNRTMGDLGITSASELTILLDGEDESELEQ